MRTCQTFEQELSSWHGINASRIVTSATSFESHQIPPHSKHAMELRSHVGRAGRHWEKAVHLAFMSLWSVFSGGSRPSMMNAMLMPGLLLTIFCGWYNNWKGAWVQQHQCHKSMFMTLTPKFQRGRHKFNPLLLSDHLLIWVMPRCHRSKWSTCCLVFQHHYHAWVLPMRCIIAVLQSFQSYFIWLFTLYLLYFWVLIFLKLSITYFS